MLSSSPEYSDTTTNFLIIIFWYTINSLDALLSPHSIRIFLIVFAQNVLEMLRHIDLQSCDRKRKLE